MILSNRENWEDRGNRENSDFFVLGLDEVGRGPLAGPVGVGGVLFPPTPRSGGLYSFFEDYSWAKQITDSKKLSFGQRSYLASEILACPQIVSATALVSAQRIDEIGINKAIGEGLQTVVEQLLKVVEKSLKGRKKIVESSGTVVKDSGKIVIQLDGKVDYGLRGMFPELEIETIVKGDQKVWEIAAASIVAKVQRDQYMIDLSQQGRYSMYGFERHKGYGTKLHREAIQQYGLSDEHRKSFIHFV